MRMKTNSSVAHAAVLHKSFKRRILPFSGKRLRTPPRQVPAFAFGSYSERMGDVEYFLSLKPAWPWSSYPLGLPALGLVVLLLAGLTYFTYRRAAAGSRRRVAIIFALRMLALLLALAAALRPSLGIQEDPKVPSTLLIGVDLSESMTLRDALDNQPRIAAVRRVLERSGPLLESLKAEQNVNVVLYAFGKADFSEPNAAYSPDAPADFKRSDYGIYLQRTLDRWQTERFVRAHLIIGDGADNGTAASAEAEAARWRATAPVHTFSVGKITTRPDGRDVAILGVSADPSPVPIKNDVTLTVNINAFGYPNARVPIVVFFNDEQVAREETVLAKELGNQAAITVKAPETPGEVKVRVEIPHASTQGDVNPANNVLETYLTVTKEGVRLLIVDRDRFEHTLIREALRTEKRFDITDVVRQRADPASPDERSVFDFDNRFYDAIVLGNVSARQLQAIDPQLPEKIAKQVLEKGTGLIMLGGDASFAGTGERPLDTGWRGTAIESLLPVTLGTPRGVNEGLFRGDDRRFQTVPTERGLQYLMNVANSPELSRQLWDRLNDARPPNRLTAIARMGDPKPGAIVYATATDRRELDPAGARADKLAPPWLLVGWETEASGRGRVLAFAGYDTYLWKPFGRRSDPPTRDGQEIHAQFWRRVMLWLARQDESDGAAYARPEFRRLPVRGKQSIAVGLRTPEGAELPDASFDVKIIEPGMSAEQAAVRKPIKDAKGGNVVPFEPARPGEYEVRLVAKGTDSAGKAVEGEAAARFIAYPEASDELLRAAADPEFLERIARAGGGQAYDVADLPRFLTELQGQPLATGKKPRFVPDWRRSHSRGFLPGLVIAFALVLGLEWGLRRHWGMA